MAVETTRLYRRSLPSELSEELTQRQRDTPASPAGQDDATKALGLAGNGDIARGDTMVPTSVEQLRSGTRLGRYQVLGHIGRGGLGDVYAAFDAKLDRKVAIKLLRPTAHDKSLGDPTQRLLREAQALAKLRHPNVVAVFDVGTFRDEVFVAMEFVKGLTLTRWLNEKNPDWQTIRDAYVRAGEGLAAAHTAGLVHRDFKLDNVIVDDAGSVTVLDFGLARAIGQIDPAHSGMMAPVVDGATTPYQRPVGSLLQSDVTCASLVLGTPPYMSPELLTGEAAAPSSDQFAFCVALFKGLYRRLPFASGTMADHYAAVTKRRISFGDAEADAAVPRWLRKVIERGLEPAPTDRYPSMGALLDALVADKRRQRRGWLALAISVPLLSIGTAVASIALRPEPTVTERALTLQLAEEARAAAANGYYVFPPANAPDTPTALTKVVELESLKGAASEAGEQAGLELRGELSEALARLGDRYFGRPGGPAFAADFYAAALVFDGAHARARDRVTLTTGQLTEFIRRANAGDFASGELQAAEALAVLAVADEDKREERLRDYFARTEALSVTQPAPLEVVLDGDERAIAAAAKRTRKKKKKKSQSPAPRPAPADPEPEASEAGNEVILVGEIIPVDEVLIDEPPPASPDPLLGAAATEPGSSAPAKATPARRAEAKAEAKAGSAALRAGQLGKAETHFYRALGKNRRNVTALAGLAEIRFERGDYEQALKFAKRAVRVAPRKKGLYVSLGDCHVKLLGYDEARKAYEKGIALGSQLAGKRLKRLDAKLGR